jgi:hypothetical protein
MPNTGGRATASCVRGRYASHFPPLLPTCVTSVSHSFSSLTCVVEVCDQLVTELLHTGGDGGLGV